MWYTGFHSSGNSRCLLPERSVPNRYRSLMASCKTESTLWIFTSFIVRTERLTPSKLFVLSTSHFDFFYILFLTKRVFPALCLPAGY
ncbi:Uncharacterized protein HZ326_3161 [Fusarium oxysporum f. sp. albedinis]|nr:Uncharacterized protein HZ326_3161 [Fusarium oxysporum f. sp. albedinis]